MNLEPPANIYKKEKIKAKTTKHLRKINTVEERHQRQQIRESTLGNTMLIRGEASDDQILTGLIGHAEETGLYGLVRGPVEGFHQGMALSY